MKKTIPIFCMIIILAAGGAARAEKRACCAAHQGICGCYCCDGVPLPDNCDESERNACWWGKEPPYEDSFRWHWRSSEKDPAFKDMMSNLETLYDIYLDKGYITEQDTLPKDAVTIIIKGGILTEQGRLVGNSTMVPLRGVVELLGARVDYVDYSGEILIRIKGETLGLQMGSPLVYSRRGSHYLDVPPMLINGRVFVPVRFISEYFGATVIWDNPTRTVKIIY